MLQTRTRVLDGTPGTKFQSWYPELFSNDNAINEQGMAAAWPQVFGSLQLPEANYLQ